MVSGHAGLRSNHRTTRVRCSIQTWLKRFHHFDEFFEICEACFGAPGVDSLIDVVSGVWFHHSEETRSGNDGDQDFAVLDGESKRFFFVRGRSGGSEELHVQRNGTFAEIVGWSSVAD